MTRHAAAVCAGTLIGASLLCACAAPGHRDAGTAPAVGRPAPATVYVVRRGWHIDVGFAADDLHGPLAAIAAPFSGACYVFFGFGDRRYLMSKHHRMPALLAALWPGAGLILVTAIEGTPRQAFGAEHVVELELTATQSNAIQVFVERSFSTPPDQTLAPYAPGPYPGSAYFAAVPRYSGLHTCNTWAAEALQAGGLAIRSRFTLVAAQLWRQVQRLRAAAGVEGSVAGRRVAVLANHGRVTALRHDDGRLGGRRGAAAADATG